MADASVAQYAGDGSDRRDRQSVFLHLSGLGGVRRDEVRLAAWRLLGRWSPDSDSPVLQRGRQAGEVDMRGAVGNYRLSRGEGAVRVGKLAG